MAEGTEMNVEAERAEFEAWAELTDHQKHGANHEVIRWYYFDEVTQDRWEAWQASAVRRAAQPAHVGAGELLPLPEPDVIAYANIGDNDAYNPMLVERIRLDAIAADRRAREEAGNSLNDVLPREHGSVTSYGSPVDNLALKFPELPEPQHELQSAAKTDAYTAEQMFKYGRACVEFAAPPLSSEQQEDKGESA
jgi:hypothetical protein